MPAHPQIPVLLALLAAAHGQAINLAKFQDTTASSTAPGLRPEEATDGIVSNESRWYSSSDGGSTEWLQVTLAESFTVGSAHLYTGLDAAYPIADFSLQYRNGSSAWQTIRSFSGNTATDFNIIFPAPVVADQFRIHTSTDDVIRVKEIALFPPNGGSGHPLGTDVNLNLGSLRRPTVSSTGTYSGVTYHPQYGVDRYVDNSSRWLGTNVAGAQDSFEANFTGTHQVGSIHLHSGYGGTGWLADFDLEYWGGGWQPVPIAGVSAGTFTGNSVSGANADAVVIDLSPDISTDSVRIRFSNHPGRIREFICLPPNRLEDGSSGYPPGASVTYAPRPTTRFTDFHDSWHQLALRGSHPRLVVDPSSARLADSADPTGEKNYQLLYSHALDAFRIINQANEKCLQPVNASQAAGAAIEEGAFAGAPHQLWTLHHSSEGYYQIRNLWSGHVITSSASSGSTARITQQPFDHAGDPSNNKEWKPLFHDRLFAKGTGGWLGNYGAQWGYNWGRDGSLSGINRFFAPMQHREGWENLATIHTYYPRWQDNPEPIHLLGFNEPDRPDQANMSTATALDLWPQLEAMDLPLLSPACAQGGEDWWLTPFMDSIDSGGYRCEYAGGHWYSSPTADHDGNGATHDVASANNIISHINDISNDGNGRHVWLTEFSCIDWSGGSGTWSEEDCYNFLLEFLWRAESQSNLRKYAIFVFTGGVPTNPWDKTNPRSNMQDGSGNLHAFGKAYAAWDGDTTIRDRQPYLLHNRSYASRLRNNGGGVEGAWLRREDDSVQWILQDAGGGSKFITSLVDGRRLRYSGGALDYAPAGTTGTAVEWAIEREQYGWHNIIHTGTDRFLRLLRDPGNPWSISLEMVTRSTAETGWSGESLTSTDWHLVKPYEPVSVANPPTPTGLAALAADGSVHLSWSDPGSSAHSHFRIYRRVAGSGSWSLLQDGVPATKTVDSSAANGVNYQYAVSAVNHLADESSLGSPAAAMPSASDPAAAITYVDASRSNLARADGAAWNPPGDSTTGIDNEWEERTGFANNGNAWESGGEGAEDAPRLHMTLSGLAPAGLFDLFAYFWTADGNSWQLRAGHPADNPVPLWVGWDNSGMPGLHADPLSTAAPTGTFTNPGLGLAVTPDGFHYGNHFANAPGTILLEEGNRSLYQAPLGQFAADAGGRLEIAVDDLPPGGNQSRSWFDGLGHRATASPPPFAATSVGRIGNAVTLRWESYANFTYDIVATTDPAGGFPIIIAGGITPSGLQTSHRFPLPPSLVNEPRAFFRIIAR